MSILEFITNKSGSTVAGFIIMTSFRNSSLFLIIVFVNCGFIVGLSFVKQSAIPKYARPPKKKCVP
jgi:hypothetical protein